MSKPTIFYDDELHAKFTRVPPPVTVKPANARRGSKWVTLGLFVVLVAVYVVEWLIQH